jgi:hypothetical protein
MNNSTIMSLDAIQQVADTMGFNKTKSIFTQGKNQTVRWKAYFTCRCKGLSTIGSLLDRLMLRLLNNSGITAEEGRM